MALTRRWGMTAAAIAAAVLLPACGRSEPRTVEITIRHSRFEPSAIRVPPGSLVSFVIRNADPIDHELLVGDEAFQDRHERGTEGHHGARPGEVSVPAETTRTTRYRFPASGRLLMGCHLPGHWDYGMRGAITVA